MVNEALFATAGLFGLFVAMLTGALWDTQVVVAGPVLPVARSALVAPLICCVRITPGIDH